MKFVILAGGIGSRLWPLSRKDKPKQFIPLFDEETLLENTYKRLKKIAAPADIFIILNAQLAELARDTVPEIPAENYIIEPSKRNTAPAFGLACAQLMKIAPDEPVAFIPADHFIHNEELFVKNLQRAEKLIQETGKMLDIGITPNFPSTALGYTQIGERVSQEDGIEVYEFKGHKEKPDFELAQKFLHQGNYLWHANYYMWTPAKFLQAFKNYAPEDYEHLQKIVATDDEQVIAQKFNQLTKVMLDYLITEKMNPADVLILKGDFGWSDVGAWDVIHDAQKKHADERGNVCQANSVDIDSTNCLIYGKQEKLIATMELDNLAIIDTEDALLICPKSRAQEVKKLIELIKNDPQNSNKL